MTYPANNSPADGMAEHYENLDFVQDLRAGLARNDERIRTAELHDGWTIVQERGHIIREALRGFLEYVVAETPPPRPIAIHALGGTGRQEMGPGSDVDVGILVENIEENQRFLASISQQLQWFAPHVPGMRPMIKANAYLDLEDAKHFDLVSLVSLMDGDLLVGDFAFDDRIRRAGQRRAAEMAIDLIFSINRDLSNFDRLYPQLPGDVGGFHVKNGIGGLRNFQMTMWLYSFERWIPAFQVYEQARSTRRFDNEGAPTPEVLDAVGVIMSTRCWIEQRRAEFPTDEKGKRLQPLFIGVRDMEAFLTRFGAGGLTQLNLARETIRAYRRESFDRLLERGITVPDTRGHVIWGSGGLRIGPDALFQDATTLFFAVYSAQQRFNLPIDKTVKRAAGKNLAQSLRPDETFIRILTSMGSVYYALKDWYDYGILDKLIPGFEALANQLYQPGHRSATLTRAARAMQRLESLEAISHLKPSEVPALESYFVRQYRDLGGSARGALRLALLTEEIPESLYGRQANYADSVHRYVTEHLATVPGLSAPTLRTIEFLLLTKRELIKASETSDQEEVLSIWHERIKNINSRDPADTVRSLALFAFAAFDFHNPEGVTRVRLDLEQWLNVQNLTQNLLYNQLGLVGQPFEDKYFDETGRRIGKLLPSRLLSSPHVNNSLRQTYEGETLDPQRAHRLINNLKSVVQTREPKVQLQVEESYYRLTLSAWDFPGLFWRVAHELFMMGCAIRSTDLYGIPDPSGQATDGDEIIQGEDRLVLDVITFDAMVPTDEAWEEEIRNRVLYRLQHPDEPIRDDIHDILGDAIRSLSPELTELGPGYAKFSCTSPSHLRGVRYAIARLLSEKAGASLESIARDGTYDWPEPRTNFYVRIPHDIASVRDKLRDIVGEIVLQTDRAVT